MYYLKIMKHILHNTFNITINTILLTVFCYQISFAQAVTKKVTTIKKTDAPIILEKPKPVPTLACPNILKFTALRLQDEEPQALCQYAGKVVMVVNTASYCGFTGQYEELQQLQRQYKASGLVILGFPSNDFGDQEPGSNKQIASFCKNTYSVEFPMFAKSVVSGVQMNPFFKALRDFTGISPRWNFHKYLISRDGQKIQSFDSWQSPVSNSVRKAVVNALLQPNPFAVSNSVPANKQ
jgi:glutathione peroxidase